MRGAIVPTRIPLKSSRDRRCASPLPAERKRKEDFGGRCLLTLLFFLAAISCAGAFSPFATYGDDRLMPESDEFCISSARGKRVVFYLCPTKNRCTERVVLMGRYPQCFDADSYWGATVITKEPTGRRKRSTVQLQGGEYYRIMYDVKAGCLDFFVHPDSLKSPQR